MVDCEYPIYTNLWFWLIAIGILLFAIGLIIWDVRVNLDQTWWVWVLIIGGGLLLLIGLILAIWKWWSQDGNSMTLDDDDCMPLNELKPLPQPVPVKKPCPPRQPLPSTRNPCPPPPSPRARRITLEQVD